MPAVQDFRRVAFTTGGVCKSGRNIGNTVYWKLYAVENYYRVLLHSILSVQIGPNWWQFAVDLNIQRKAVNFRQQYAVRPWHTNPGSHDIYYVDLKDLNEIARANINLIQPVVTDIDLWIGKIESIRLPRNVVAHMNFPNRNGRRKIDLLHEDFKVLIGFLLSNSNVAFQIP